MFLKVIQNNTFWGPARRGTKKPLWKHLLLLLSVKNNATCTTGGVSQSFSRRAREQWVWWRKECSLLSRVGEASGSRSCSCCDKVPPTAEMHVLAVQEATSQTSWISLRGEFWKGIHAGSSLLGVATSFSVPRLVDTITPVAASIVTGLSSPCPCLPVASPCVCVYVCPSISTHAGLCIAILFLGDPS